MKVGGVSALGSATMTAGGVGLLTGSGRVFGGGSAICLGSNLGLGLGNTFGFGGSGAGSGVAVGKGSGALGGASSTLRISGTLIESNLKLGSQIAANICKLMDSATAQTNVWLEAWSCNPG